MTASGDPVRAYTWPSLRISRCSGWSSLSRWFLPVNIQFSNEGHLWVVASFCVGGALLAASGLLPKRRVSVVINAMAIGGTLWFSVQLVRVHARSADPVALQFPVEDEWYVMQGGPSVLYNHHYGVRAQRDALDLVVVEGRSTRRAGIARDRLDSFLAFGAPVRSPARGTVATVAADHPDQPLGTADRNNPAGNHVVIDIGRGRFVLLGHLRAGSVTVAPGDPVEAGTVIGQVGNSGNTSEPHLHIQIQDAPTLEGVSRTWPITFTESELERGGADYRGAAVAPRRDDRIRRQTPHG